MRVDGKAFRQAREEIRKNARQTRGKRGEPAKGTQEWLANVATIRTCDGELMPLSVRTVQYLERGSASIQTIDAVSPHLGLNGRSLILDYGQDAITVDAPGIIDLRPEASPHKSPETFQESAMLLSIDPLTIRLNPEEMDATTLERVTAVLQVGESTTTFRWLYRVQLTSNGQGWLGIEEEVFPQEITTGIYKATFMFRQTNYPQWSWEKTINLIENTEVKLIKMTLNLEFKYFVKTLHIGLSASQARTYFMLGRKKRKSAWPFMIQPDALIWESTSPLI